MLLLHLQDPSATTYHMAFLLKFNEGFRPCLLQNLHRLFSGTKSVFRTRFSSDGRALADARAPEMQVLENDDFVSSSTKRDALAPFDLTKGPLARAWVARSEAVFVTHHAIFDGRSVQILLEHLRSGGGEEGEEEERGYSVRDYGQWEESVDDWALDKWGEVLEGCLNRFEVPTMGMAGGEGTGRSLSLDNYANHTIFLRCLS